MSIVELTDIIAINALNTGPLFSCWERHCYPLLARSINQLTNYPILPIIISINLSPPSIFSLGRWKKSYFKEKWIPSQDGPRYLWYSVYVLIKQCNKKNVCFSFKNTSMTIKCWVPFVNANAMESSNCVVYLEKEAGDRFPAPIGIYFLCKLFSLRFKVKA